MDWLTQSGEVVHGWDVPTKTPHAQHSHWANLSPVVSELRLTRAVASPCDRGCDGHINVHLTTDDRHVVTGRPGKEGNSGGQGAHENLNQGASGMNMQKEYRVPLCTEKGVLFTL